MLGTAIGFVIGLVVGAESGTALGAFAGAVLGGLVGMSVSAFVWAWVRLGDQPTVEQHTVMCTSFGHAADLELVGDVGRGRFYDVKSCSLLRPFTQVDCEKGCLRQINLSGVHPGQACAGCSVGNHDEVEGSHTRPYQQPTT